MPREKFSCDCDVVHGDVVKRVSREMLKEDMYQDMAAFFKLFGDETRMRIIWALDKHEMCVCDLSALLGMTKSAISHQLASLRREHVVRHRRDGKNVYYSLDDEHVQEVIETGYEHVRHSRRR